MSGTPPPVRYDLLVFNLVLALIAALLMAAVGSSLTVVQLLDGLEIAGVQIDLAVGVAVNLGVFAGSATIFFAMIGALCRVWHNRLQQGRSMAAAVSVGSWVATTIALASFVLTLLTVPLTLAVEVGL